MVARFQLVQALFGKDTASSLRIRLARGAVGTFGLEVASVGLSFISTVALARMLGTTGYGAFHYAMAWVGLLSVPAVFGFKNLLIRNIAAYEAQSAWGLMGGLLRWANQFVLMISLGLVLLATGVAWGLAKHLDFQMLSALRLGLFILPLVALISLRQGTLQGLHYVVTGRLPEALLRPLLFICLVGGVYLLLGEELTATWAVGLNMTATVITLMVGTHILYRALPRAVRGATPRYQRGMWVRSALPMMFITGMRHILNGRTDILMLGAMTGAEAVAIYNVADRGAQFVAFTLAAVNVALSPTIASLYVKGDLRRLQRIVTESTRIVLCVAACIVVILLAFGDRFLLLFGAEFTRGYHTLTILNIGQLINVAMGPVDLLLIMTGQERDAAVGIGASAGLNILLLLILIPRWGLEGAATATAISIITWNVWLAVRVYKRLGIHPTALGITSAGRGR